MYETMYQKLGRWIKAAVKGQAMNLPDYQPMVKAAEDLRQAHLMGASSFLVSTRGVIESAGENAAAMIHVPEPESVFLASGGQYFNPALLGEFNIPRFDKIEPEWLAATDTPLASHLPSGHENVAFNPHRLMTFLDIAKNILSESDEAVGRRIYEQMEISCMELIDRTAFGIQERTSIMPQGIGYSITYGIDSGAAEITPTLSAIKAQIQKLVTAKGFRSPVFVTSPTGAVLLQTTPIATGSDRYLMEDGKILNIPVFVSENVSDEAGTGGAGSLLALASMKNIALVQFGQWQIVVDPLTMARNNTVRLILQGYFDIKGLKGSAETDLEPEVPGEPESQPFEYADTVACIALTEPE